ncbi:MAG: hypothetical protein ACT6U0_08395 [Shinella sp.]|uniref:hypothetical protein n=1 Tax=Shinella sp. TaxID=1870904 RepID=UPI004036D44F
MPKKPALVRSLESADNNYAAAKELLARLKAGASKLDGEENELRYRLANRPVSAERTSRVAALLGDATPDDGEAPDGISARLKAIAAERVDLRAAIDIASQRLQTARHAASRAICAEVAPDYRERVKALADKLVAAHAAHQELLELIDDLTRQDIAWAGAMPPMQAHGVFGHMGSKLASWLREAREAGFIAANDIPKDLIA